jgi:hypothetical protein
METKENPMSNSLKAFRRSALVLAAGAFLAAGCDTVDKLLEAENPGAISEGQLSDVALIEVLVNSVGGELTSLYDDPFIWRGSMFTDEQITGINWEQTARLNLRVIRFDEGDADGMFSAMSAYRFIADSVSGRLRNLLPQLQPAADPAKDRRMALVLAHAGYSYTLMAEVMCEATINVGDKIYSPKELAELAIPRFEEAISIATAVGSSANDVLNLARTGLARAALLAGNNAKVMSAAQNVPASFTWWVEYKDQIADNNHQGLVTGANHALGVHPKFLNGPFGTQDIVATQTDPRIQHTTRWTTGHNALTKLYKPYQGLSYSEYNGQVQASGGKPVLYDDDTDIKLASGLEAMHHYYEAAGPNGTGPLGSTLDFVNARRAFGNQTPVNLTGADLMAELREQRGRDLYFGGFRLGDLRRWKANGVGDFFPKGTHPNPEWGPYGDATCYPLPSSEYEGNPNIRKSSNP